MQAKPWYAPRLRVYDARIAALEDQQAAHDWFMFDHAADRAEGALHAQSETVMRFQQRIQTGVDPSVTIERLPGPRPRHQCQRLPVWDEAAENAREHWAEAGWQPLDDARSIEEILGPRPTDWSARHHYERIEQVCEAAHDLDRGAEIAM